MTREVNGVEGGYPGRREADEVPRRSPQQGLSQVLPAAHGLVPPPLHFTLQSSSPPHTTVQPAEPAQSAVQPPLGHSIMHALLPVQATVDPVPTCTSHVLPPPQVTVLSAPVDSMQLLVPSHVLVQFDVQLPWQVD